MWETDMLTKTFRATGAVTKQAVVMGSSADFTCKMPTGGGVVAIGVARDEAAAGQDVAVMIWGIAECVAAAAISRYARVSVADASGQIGTAGAEHHVIGIALAAATATGDLIPVLLAPCLNAFDADWAGALPSEPTFVIGLEESETINVAVQLNDITGLELDSKHSVQVWLSDAAAGAPCSTPPSGAVAIGDNGVMMAAYTAKLHFQIVSDDDGKFDLNIIEAGEKTLYVNVAYQGKVYSSDAVTFAT